MSIIDDDLFTNSSNYDIYNMNNELNNNMETGDINETKTKQKFIPINILNDEENYDENHINVGIDKNYYHIWEKYSLNVLFKDIYYYYYYRGYWSIILRHITRNILQLVFLLCFILYLNLCIEFGECKSLFKLNIINICLFIFNISIIAHIFYNIFKIPKIIDKYSKIRKIYRNILDIDDYMLSSITFSEVVEKIKYFNNEVLKKDRLEEIDIINYIMIRDNYIIGLINKKIINFRLPIIRKKYITTITEWGLFGTHNIPGLLNQTIFEKDNNVNYSFIYNNDINKSITNFKKRSKIIGIILLILSPLILIYLLTNFLFKFTEEIMTAPNLLSSRRWNTIAKYKIRDFNELSDSFQKRLNYSYKHTIRYISYFETPIIKILSEFILFILGAQLLTSIIIKYILFNNDNDYNNMIYNDTIILGIIIVSFRTFVPNEYKVYDYKKTMKKIIKYIHYFPTNWIENANNPKIKDKLTNMFSYKGINWIMEIFGVILVPLWFIFVLPKDTEEILLFMQKFTITHPKIGYICKFALLDIEQNGNQMYGSTYENDIEEQSKYGKLEMSLINFKETYPKSTLKNTQEEFIKNINQSNLYTSNYNDINQTIDTLSGMLDNVNKYTNDLEKNKD
jgi:autophagy-related protein 9